MSTVVRQERELPQAKSEESSAFRPVRMSTQALQQTRQAGITTGWRAPVHMHDRDTVRRELCGKQLQAHIDDSWANRKQRWQACWKGDRCELVLEERGISSLLTASGCAALACTCTPSAAAA